MSFGGSRRPHESRRFGRRATNYTGWIRVPGRPSRVCIVRNVSLGGALLECEHPRALPFKFELYIPGTNTHYGCEVRRQTESEVGVEFCPLQRHDAPQGLPPLGNKGPAEWGWARARPVRNVGIIVEAMKSATEAY